MNIGDVPKVTFRAHPNWEVTYNELYSIQPSEANSIEGFTEDFTIWHSHFGEDMLQIRNTNAGLLLDVGWHPHYDPLGQYFLKLISIQQGEVLWESPILSFETRNLASLVTKIYDLLETYK
jgi:hypothetical protein